MAFYFGQKKADALMSKINLRDISARARQWDHAVKGLLKCSASKEYRNDIRKFPKKDRELYCVSLVALALKNDTSFDWWINIPKTDPPDGLVMTLQQEKGGVFKGYMRQIEVVEHRSEPGKLFNVIRDKMTEKLYDPDTTLVCLILVTAIYDLKALSQKLKQINSSLKHIFVIFGGVALNGTVPTTEQLHTSFSMAQLLPVFEQTTFNLQPHLNDFEACYSKGQESRLIENNELHYGIVNPKYNKLF